MAFECKVCLEIPRDRRLYQCPRGHSICESCIVQIFARSRSNSNVSTSASAVQPKCPECRMPYPRNPVRNYGLEEALRTNGNSRSDTSVPFPQSPDGGGLGLRQKPEEDNTALIATAAGIAGVGLGLLGAWLFGKSKDSKRQN